MLRQECLYCKIHLNDIEEEEIDTVRISHGVCSDCLPKFVAGTGTPYADFLDSLPVPLFVVSPESCVVFANTKGRSLISEDLAGLQNCPPAGEVFECTYAKSLKGCGETLHCKSCTIRNTVLATATTGINYERIPAYMDLGAEAGQKTVRFRISTQQIGAFVLLRIDDVKSLEQLENNGETNYTHRSF